MRVLTGLRDNVAFAVGAVRTHTMRSLLTILGIIVGVATVICMVSVIEGFNRVVIGSFTSFGSTLVQFQKMEPRFGDPSQAPEEQRRRPELTYEDALDIRRSCPSIAFVSAERYNFDGAPIRFGDRLASNTLIGGTTPEYPLANNEVLREGRYFSEAEFRHSAQVVVLAQDVVEALFPHTDPLGRTVSLAGRPFRVVGILERKGAFFFAGSDNRAFIPLPVFDSLWPEVAEVWGTNIATVPVKPEWVSRAMDEGREVLRRRHHLRPDEPDDFAIMTPDFFINTFRQISGGIAVVLTFIASVSLLVGGVGVMNIMLVSVTERTREIGVRKAVGARRRDITLQFLTEAMTLTGLGGVAGIAAGWLIVQATGRLSTLEVATPAWAAAAGILMSVSVGLFFGIYPAWKAARLDPIDCLHYE